MSAAKCGVKELKTFFLVNLSLPPLHCIVNLVRIWHLLISHTYFTPISRFFRTFQSFFRTVLYGSFMVLFPGLSHLANTKRRAVTFSKTPADTRQAFSQELPGEPAHARGEQLQHALPEVLRLSCGFWVSFSDLSKFRQCKRHCTRCTFDWVRQLVKSGSDPPNTLIRITLLMHAV